MRLVKTSALSLIAVLTAFLSSCVHEFPEFSQNVTVSLTIHHELDWTEYDYVVGIPTRADDAAHRARYIIYAFPEGAVEAPVRKFEFYRDDESLQDFTTTITLPPGKWDIRAWQDHEPIDATPYYNADNFSKITYTEPYRGDIEQREAFEGLLTVEVPETYDTELSVAGTINMERPMGKYVFIATDFEKFYNETLTRNEKYRSVSWSALPADKREEVLKGYSIVVLYPYFMPSVYNCFTQRIMDSEPIKNFGAEILPLSSTEAKIASDHVFMNHHESGVQVQLGLRTPSGEVLKLTDVITVPMKRGQITYVRGKFLTAGVGSGLNINFDFSDDINIEIR